MMLPTTDSVRKTMIGETRDWAVKVFPNFHGRKAFCLPGAFYNSIVSMMAAAGFEKATNVDDADVIVFAGGADINPALYGEEPHPFTSFSPERCEYEKQVYKEALSKKKVMFGICRGAQFLHAMNGGKLWQHVEGHGREHMIVDIEDNVRLRTSSMHHQMLQANDRIQIIAVAEEQVSTVFEDANLKVKIAEKGSNQWAELEIEAGCYPETRCFFTQGHPEVGPVEYTAWTLQKLHDFYFDWEGVQGGDMTSVIAHLNNIGSVSIH